MLEVKAVNKIMLRFYWKEQRPGGCSPLFYIKSTFRTLTNSRQMFIFIRLFIYTKLFIHITVDIAILDNSLNKHCKRCFTGRSKYTYIHTYIQSVIKFVNKFLPLTWIRHKYVHAWWFSDIGFHYKPGYHVTCYKFECSHWLEYSLQSECYISTKPMKGIKFIIGHIAYNPACN